MSKVILSLDGKVLKEYPLNKERIVIGRKPGNDIPIDNLAVSGEHAVIITILNDSFLEDLASTNGTKVNGNPIKKCFLQNKDVIEIGKFKLTYFNEPAAKAPPAPSAADFEKTRVLRPAAVAALIPASVSTPPEQSARPAPPAPSVQPAPQLVQPPAPPKAPGLHAAIQILSGPSIGRELDLVKNLTTIGKPGVQVAVITRRPNGYFITHVDGPKSPLLNGKQIDLHPHPLSDHDIIELLGIKMEFFIK